MDTIKLLRLLGLFCLCIVGCGALADLNDTGIDWGGDYPSGNNESCTSNLAAPQDCNQGRDDSFNDETDGHAGFSFVAMDDLGQPTVPSSGAIPHACVKDLVTGLIWEVKTDDNGLHDKDWTYSWYDSNPATNAGYPGYPDYTDNCFTVTRCDTEKYVADVNAEGWCGFHDWRLPTVAELQSIVDNGRSAPTIDRDYFPNTRYYYWASTPVPFVGYVWQVNFNFGIDGTQAANTNYSIRLVRGGNSSTYLLYVAKVGLGTGTVTSFPGGIRCGTDCSEAYAAGTNVTLTATPTAGHSFAGWSGDCSGTGSCVVAMTAAKGVTATFTAPPTNYTLTVAKAGTGTGTVTSNPAGIDCGSDCSQGYVSGTVVTLTATPDSGSTFDGWSGACSGGLTTCPVTMTAAKSVTATFGSGSCPASITLENENARDYWLDLLYQVRDEVLARHPNGSWMKNAYYEHGAEVNLMLRNDVRLRQHALRVLWALRDNVKAAVDGSTLRLDESQRMVVRRFVNDLQAGASPKLREDLEVFLEMF
ncbi:DUF1566 domain-containing protein [Thiococcus pfennigii]|uniref:DUF1566 domain-containing protein n=1 Tax=Thiococcus pfennigii TaxID=1057 RepID=UPI001908BD98|nr:DUF1566 domain-containing protein [Thiococcus pfennigii]MBK1700588.1 hypothetical protein [Thiococcus pfennigii]